VSFRKFIDGERSQEPTPKEDPNGPPAPLRDWTSLTEDVKLPGDLTPGFMSARPELIRVREGRTFNEEETQAVVHALRVLVETNVLLQGRSREIAKRVKNVLGAVENVRVTLSNLDDEANYRTPHPRTDES